MTRYRFTFDLIDEVFGAATIREVDVDLEINTSIEAGEIAWSIKNAYLPDSEHPTVDGDPLTQLIGCRAYEAAEAEISNGGRLFERIVAGDRYVYQPQFDETGNAGKWARAR